MISRPIIGQSILILDATSVMRTWCGRNAELGFRYKDEGVNKVSDRAYNVEINDWGDNSRDSRSGCGKSTRSGVEAKTVVSRVIRRMSHFLRWTSRGSGEGASGGGMSANAALNKVNVIAMSR